MYKNHCKKQYSVRLPSSCSTINGTKPLQKTARRATPLFSHLTLFHPLISERCKAVAKNSTSCNHTFSPRHPTAPFTSTPTPKPLRNRCKKQHSVRLHPRSTVAATPSTSLTPRHTFNTPQHTPNMPQDGPNMAQDGLKTAQNMPNVAQDSPKTGPRWLQTGPRWPNAGPTWPKTGRKWLQTGPGWPKTGPRWPKTAPRRPERRAGVSVRFEGFLSPAYVKA